MLGYMMRMDHQRTPQQALYWEGPGYRRGPGRPRTNWRSTVNKKKMGLAWEEAEVASGVGIGGTRRYPPLTDEGVQAMYLYSLLSFFIVFLSYKLNAFTVYGTEWPILC